MDFQANFEELRATGNTLQSKANAYQEEIAAIYKQVEQLQQSWTGADNQAFVNKVNSYKDPMVKLGNAIQESGQFLVQVANVVEDTQNQIAEAAGRI